MTLLGTCASGHCSWQPVRSTPYGVLVIPLCGDPHPAKATPVNRIGGYEYIDPPRGDPLLVLQLQLITFLCISRYLLARIPAVVETPYTTVDLRIGTSSPRRHHWASVRPVGSYNCHHSLTHCHQIRGQARTAIPTFRSSNSAAAGSPCRIHR